MFFSLLHPFKFSSLVHIEIYSQGTFDNYWCPYFWILSYLHFKICLHYEKKGFCLSYSFPEGEEESHLGSGWEGFLMAACFLNWQNFKAISWMTHEPVMDKQMRQLPLHHWLSIFIINVFKIILSTDDWLSPLLHGLGKLHECQRWCGIKILNLFS